MFLLPQTLSLKTWSFSLRQYGLRNRNLLEGWMISKGKCRRVKYRFHKTLVRKFEVTDLDKRRNGDREAYSCLLVQIQSRRSWRGAERAFRHARIGVVHITMIHVTGFLEDGLCIAGEQIKGWRKTVSHSQVIKHAREQGGQQQKADKNAHYFIKH